MKTFLKRDTHQQASGASAGTRQFADNRAEAVAQRRQQQLMEGGAQPAQLQAQGIVQREGGGSEWDLDNLKGRGRSDAVTERPQGVPGRIDVSRMEGLLAPGGGGASPLNAAAVAAMPEEGLFSKFKRKVFGDKRSTAEKAQAMAAASAQKNIADRAKANQVGLLGNTVARYLPGVDSQQALAAAAGQKAIAHENADAHKKIKSSLAYKGGGMALSGAASGASMLPVDPLSQTAIKAAAKLGGAALSHVGAEREGQSGSLLTEQAATRDHGVMTMNLSAEGLARTENSKLNKKEARSAAVKAAIPSVPMLGAVGVDETIGKAVTGVASTAAGKLLDPTAAEKAAVKGHQADAQISKERLGAESIHGVSKSLSKEENTRIKQQQDIMRSTQAGMLARFGIGQQAAVTRLRPASDRPEAPGVAPLPAEPEFLAARRALRPVKKEEEGR